MISKKIREELEKQHYKIVGNHSACKICTWTKKDLRDEKQCYKADFYGIKSYLCCQMTPSLICPNTCVFCWRTMDKSMIGNKLEKVDETKDIVDGCIRAQRELLSGFPGDKRTNIKKFKEAQNPKYFAISLAGEPTIYDKLNNLIEELNKRKCCSFLVTNGLFPEKLKKLNKLPVQLYVSLDAPTKEIYNKVCRPSLRDAWERLNKSLELLNNLDTRKVIRLTLVKDWNMCNEREYTKLIKKADVDFIEVKAYMCVGSSRERLKLENMPKHNEIKEFAMKISELSGYEIIGEKENSRVVLLSNENKKRKIKEF